MEKMEQRKRTSEIFDNYQAKTIPVEENTFPFVFADLTYKCNMKCNLCYNPVRPIPDMKLDYFEEALRKLPNKTEIRLLGGEPTIHKNFFDFLEAIFKYGHNAYMSTNGVKIAKDLQFAKEIKSIAKNAPDGAKLKIHMDMSGGLNRLLYKKIHAEDVLDNKIQCLENLSEVGLGRVTISSVLIRGLNEKTVEDLFELAMQYRQTVREVAFRSQGAIGRYIGPKDLPPYLTNEWLSIMMKKGFLNRQRLAQVIHSGYMDDRCEGRNCCFQYRYNKRLTVSFLEFLNNGCWQRGQLLEQGHEIEYMFESLRANDYNRLFK